MFLVSKAFCSVRFQFVRTCSACTVVTSLLWECRTSTYALSAGSHYMLNNTIYFTQALLKVNSRNLRTTQMWLLSIPWHIMFTRPHTSSCTFLRGVDDHTVVRVIPSAVMVEPYAVYAKQFLSLLLLVMTSESYAK